MPYRDPVFLGLKERGQCSHYFFRPLSIIQHGLCPYGLDLKEGGQVACLYSMYSLSVCYPGSYTMFVTMLSFLGLLHLCPLFLSQGPMCSLTGPVSSRYRADLSHPVFYFQLPSFVNSHVCFLTLSPSLVCDLRLLFSFLSLLHPCIE